jgi:hypothetical protein
MKNRAILTTASPNTRSTWRLAWTTLFATTLAFCLVPTGCAATDDFVEAPPQPSELAQSTEHSLSPSEIAALQTCANERAGRLSRHSYEISFEVQATGAGVVRDVEPQGKRLDDTELEACFIRALKEMQVVDLLPVDEPLPATSQSILPPARSLIGTTTVLPQVIRLAPVVLSVSGVTIIVSVG